MHLTYSSIVDGLLSLAHTNDPRTCGRHIEALQHCETVNLIGVEFETAQKEI
jgi:hypothetical protein